MMINKSAKTTSIKKSKEISNITEKKDEFIVE
jgi:hypothetical protein